MRRGFIICREGLPFVGGGLITTVVLGAVWGWPAGLGGVAVTLFIVYFFRDPERVGPDDPAAIVSPADGRVIEISEGLAGRYLEGTVRKVVIFLSIFNVHVNRIPASGRVREIRYNPGKFLIGYAPKASLENEQNGIIVETDRGVLAFVQIAGLVARRIICYLKAGQSVRRGERFGLIRFGSRVDLFLPPNCQVAVAVGDRVQGGVTTIARFR